MNNKKGFTLLETLISIVVFGLLMVLMFHISARFFQLFNASSSKQSMNNQFLKTYTHLQKELSITDSRYVYSYKIYLKDIKARWMIFPIPTDTNGQMKSEGNKFNWQRVYFYYLHCTNPDCPECKTKNYYVDKESQLKNEAYKFCSDKNLIRLIYEYTAYNDAAYLSEALSNICDHISEYTLSIDSNFFPSEFETEIKGFNKIPVIKFIEKRVIAKDIFDMDITTNANNVKIKMSKVKKDEIKKKVEYGTTDFTKSKNKKFVENIEFMVHSKNN